MNMAALLQSFLSVVALLAFYTCYPAAGASLSLEKGTFVHLFEWPYYYVGEECVNFLAPHGYSAVQISPPQENLIITGRPWWERYQTVSYKLRTRSDTKKDLIDMIKRCNSVGVRVIVDVIINHMTAPTNSCIGTAGTECNTDTWSYPGVPYSKDHFHSLCEIENYDNATEVRVCRLVKLFDLNQSTIYVRNKIVDFMNQLVHYGIAGFRVDAAKHVYQTDLQDIYSRLDNLNTDHGFPNNTKPFIYQEVSNFGNAVMPIDYTGLGLVTTFQTGEILGRGFLGYIYLKDLQNYEADPWMLPSNYSITFIDNHDIERCGVDHLLNYKKRQSYKMAMAFMLSRGYGTPMIMSSFEFTNPDQGPPHDPASFKTLPPLEHNRCVNGFVCQHRWPEVYEMVKFRRIIKDEEIQSWWDNGKNQVAYCLGNKGFIAMNMESYPLDEHLQTCLPEGTYTDIISGQPVEVAKNGMARIVVAGFNPNSDVLSFIAIHVFAEEP